ncbi:MAG: phage tail tape measure protein [Planctomycetota bacterium]
MASGPKYGDASLYVDLDDTAAAKAARRLGRRFDRMGSSLRGMGQTGTLAFAAIAAGLGTAVGVFAGFDDQMRQVRAVTGASQTDFVELTDEAKRLGATTSFAASQVANMMAELGRAGFASGEILLASESVLALASATGTELPRAAEIAGAALRGFQLPAGEMNRVADVLSATANGTAQTLEDLFEGLKPVAPIAAAAGESIEDTAAAVGLLANNGIKGSLAGNALARAFKNLANEKIQGKLAGLGVEATDAEGNLRPLFDIIADLDGATASFGEARRLATFEELFGRGQAAAIVLAQASRGAFAELADGIRNSQGAAIETSAQMEAGIGGSFRRLMSSVEGVMIAVGEALAPTIAGVAERVGAVLGVVNEWIGQNRGLVVGIVAAVAAAGALSVGAVVLGTVLTSIATVIGAVVSGLSVLATGASVAGTVIAAAFGVVLSPVGLFAAAVIGVGEAVAYLLGLGSPLSAMLGGLGDLAAWAAGVLRDTLGGAIGWLIEQGRELLAWLGDATGDVLGFGDAAERAVAVAGAPAAIEPPPTSGGAGSAAAAAAGDRLAEAMARVGLRSQATGLGDTLAASTAGAARVAAGTFDARAIAGLVASDPEQGRIANATERTAAATETIAKRTRKPMVMGA